MRLSIYQNGRFLRATFLQRRQPEQYGLTYERHISSDLGAWVVGDSDLPTSTFLNDQWERVSYLFPVTGPASPDQIFFRVKVTHQWP